MNLILKRVFFPACFILITLFGYNEVLAQILDGNPAAFPNQGICNTKVIVNGPRNLEALRNCTVIDGHLKIILFDKPFTDKDYNMSFPELREVTDYILLFRVFGLKSLGQLFPNLALIRGRTLFVNYALTIFECKNFQEIGLKSLTKIKRGSVRFQNNAQMCYDKTIDWEIIAGSTGGHFFYENGHENCPTKESCRGCDDQLCWSSRHCQRLASPECHPECLDTCTAIGGRCYRCRHYTNDNMCVSECPSDKFLYEPTGHCVTKSLCHRLHYGLGQPWKGICLQKCPEGYKMVRNPETKQKECEPCDRLPCKKICSGGEINAITDAEQYKGCTHINGSLDIRLLGIYGTDLMKELGECFGDVEEISEFLRIHRSLPITDLKFLKNLTLIEGKQLEYNNYSLLVFENGNLEKLFDWDLKKNLTILNGTIYFQFNPKLCLGEIDKLKKLTNSTTSNYDVSVGSNGEKGSCEYFKLEAKSVVIDTNNVSITWERYFPNASDKPLVGYQLYYLEDPDDDVTTYFGGDNCFARYWKSIIITEIPNHTSKWMSKNVTDLKHSMKYAYYVETYHGDEDSHVVHSFSKSARSPVQYFTMMSELPPPLFDLRAVSYTPDSLTVYWSSEGYRGNITRFLLELHIQEDDKNYLDMRDYCKHPMKVKSATTNRKKTQAQPESLIDTCKCDELQRVWEKLFDTKNIKTSIFNIRAEQEDLSVSGLFDFHSLDENEARLRNSTTREGNAGKFVIPKDFHQPLNRPAIDNVTKDEKYHYFSTEFLSEHQNYTLSNLKHFTKYMVFLSPCIGPLPSDCGALSIVAERTIKDDLADNITSLHADALNYSTAILRWAEPKLVNGAILSYTIEYKLIDVENSEIVHLCITRLQQESNGNRFILTGIPPGTYKARVRATSLAGDGLYTNYVKFTIFERRTTIHWFPVFLMCFASFLGLTYVFYHVQKRMDCQQSDQVVLIENEELAARYDGDEEVELFGLESRRQNDEQPAEE